MPSAPDIGAQAPSQTGTRQPKRSDKAASDKKAERLRNKRRWHRGRKAEPPTDEERREELSRLENGGVVTKGTPIRGALASPVLPVKDEGMIRRKIRRSNVLSDIVMGVCVLVVIATVALLVIHQMDLYDKDGDLQSIAKTYTTTDGGDTTNLPPAVDFAALQEINPDVSGWIYIPGTNVNYPIMSSTEKEKYLRKDIYGNKSVAGSIFTDWNNAEDYSDQHMVIYGHHLPSDTMFTPVTRYSNHDFMESHKTVYVETPSTTYVLTVVGTYDVQPTEVETVTIGFPDDMGFQSYLDQRLAKCGDTVQKSDVDRRVMDKLFTLLTCTDDGQARTVVETVPTQVYPTSYVPNVRKDAGASKTTVTVNADEQKAEKEKAKEAASGGGDDGNDLLSQIKRLIYALSTRDDG